MNFSKRCRSITGESKRIVREIDDDPRTYLTEDERIHLLSDLHRILVWVGVKVPDSLPVDRAILSEEMADHGQDIADLPPEIHLDSGTVDLHRLLWRLVHEEDLSEKDRSVIEELIRILTARERMDEGLLKEKQLSHYEAKRIYNEAAGVIRALMDLKDLEKGRGRPESAKDSIQSKVEDVRRWRAFMDEVKSGKGIE